MTTTTTTTAPAATRTVTVVNHATALIEETWTLTVPADFDGTPDEYLDLLDFGGDRAGFVSVEDRVIGEEHDRTLVSVDGIDLNPHNQGHPYPIDGTLTVGQIKEQYPGQNR